jgi:hypothetical protein
MKNEIDAASTWWVSQVTVARADQLHAFRHALWTALHERFRGHWYESEPHRGQGFRCISYLPEEEKVDDLLNDSATAAGLDVAKCFQALEGGVTMWVDPGDVEVKFLSTRRHKVLYKNNALTPTKDVRTRARTRSFQKYSPAPPPQQPQQQAYHRPMGKSVSPPVRKLSFNSAEDRSLRAVSPPFVPTMPGDGSAFRPSSPPFVPPLHGGLSEPVGYAPAPQPFPMAYGSQFAHGFSAWQQGTPQCGAKESEYFYGQEQHMAVA